MHRTICLITTAVFLLTPCRALAADASYTLGAIPNQSVHHGASCEFTIQDSGPVSAKLGEQQSNTNPTFSLDPISRKFLYTPSDRDRDDFSVRFEGASGKSQEVFFHPVFKIADEFASFPTTLIQNPDPQNLDYLLVTQKKTRQGTFNGRLGVQLRLVTVSGMNVVIDDSTNKNTLYHQMHSSAEAVNSDIEICQIIADTLIVRSPIRLPQTQVNIYARKIVFERDGLIDTTPYAVDPTRIPSPPSNGADGEPGGKITIFTSEPPNLKPGVCFKLSGGKGGPPFPAKKGPNGTGVPEVRPGPGDGIWEVNTVYAFAKYNYNDPNERPFFRRGSPVWPGPGGPGIAAGTPGKGGAGAVLSCNVPIDPATIETHGGDPGNPGEVAEGGDGGVPNPARWCRLLHLPSHGIPPGHQTRWVIDTEVSAPKGPSIPAPLGLTGDTPPTKFIQTPLELLAWLRPELLDPYVSYVEDCYIAGNYQLASQLVREMLQALSQVSDKPDFQIPSVSVHRNALVTMEQRLAAQLDYFGNPIAWTPALSLEASVNAFESEIDQGIKILYFTYWLNNVDARNRETKETLEKARDASMASLRQAIGQYVSIRQELPALARQSEAVKQQITLFEQELQLREEQLLQVVKNKLEIPTWKKTLRVIGMLARVVPMGEPYTGLVGGVLDQSTRIDDATPWASISGYGNVAGDFMASHLTQEIEGTVEEEESDEPDPSDEKAIKKRVERVNKKNTSFKTKLAEFAKEADKYKVPQSQLDQELLQAEAVDPYFKELTDRVKRLNQEQSNLDSKISKLNGKASSLADEIAKTYQGISDITARIKSKLEQFDHEAMEHVKAMQKREYLRLLKYQYYLAKAYQYRMLKPYPGTLRLPKLLARIANIARGNEQELNQDQFAVLSELYKADLRDVAFEAINQAQTQGMERTQKLYFPLNREQIKALNSARTLVLKLQDQMWYLRGESNRRLVEVGIEKGDDVISGAKANLKFSFLHPARSVVVRNGSRYMFQHGSTDARGIFSWGCVFDPVTNILTKEEVSQRDESLLARLTGTPGGSGAAKQLLFSLPGAEDEITVNIETAQPSPELKKLRLFMVYDFMRDDHGDIRIDVAARPRLPLYIQSATPDVNGRDIGNSDFVRFFRPDSEVSFTAPSRYFDYEFDSWRNASGKVLSKNRTITFEATANQSLLASYRSPKSIGLMRVKQTNAQLLPR